jgi:hypothetical protein
MLNTDS